MNNVTKIAPYESTSSVFGEYLANKILHYDEHNLAEARLITGAVLVRYKRMIRDNIRESNLQLDNQQYLESCNHPDIPEVRDAIKSCGYCLETLRSHLVTFGKGVMTMFPVYDEVASLHDKAQILNVHHSHVERKVEETGRDSMLDLVMQHAEYTGDDAFVPCGESMPFFEAHQAVFHDMLLNDVEFQRRAREKFRECFPDIPMYRLTQNPDGSQDMVRIPPPLKVVGDNGEIERIVER